jgi:medium-chain acyl-[acyl-carrier-protein] hydrolase
VRHLLIKDYRVSSFLVDHRKELSLFGLLSLIQEAAWEHADVLGYGHDAMLRRGVIWALIRQQMSIAWWPRWGQDVRIRTWLRPLDGLLVNRDLEFWCEEQCFCRATALYLMLDLTHRRPAPAPMQARDFHPDERGIHDPLKIVARPGLPTLARFAIRTSDLDMHAHVNNTRIGQWLTDSVPIEAHAQQRIESYAVDFQAEMHAGETIAIEAAPTGTGSWHFQGRRQGDERIVFAATVGTVSRGHVQ